MPHAPATVARRLASWRRVAETRGHEDALKSSLLRRAFSAARKASEKTIQRKAKTSITRDILDRLVGGETTPGFLSLRELRDRTLLLVAFATGGRRRSELGGLLIENVFTIDERTIGIRLGRTKTTSVQDGEHLVATGRARAFHTAWLAALATRKAPVVAGPIFPAIDRWGNVQEKGISGKAVNDILKVRAGAAGLDAEFVSAHGLRSGYLTEASLQGVPIEQAVRHSKHRSLASAALYY